MKKLLVIIGFFITSYPALSESQHFLITQHQKTTALQPCLDKVTKAYQLLRINFTLKEYPGRRSLYMANSGQADAELCRIALIQKRYQNLLRIKPPVHHLTFHAVTRNNEQPIEEIADLKGLRIASIRGMMAAELMFEYRNVRYENTVEQTVRLLENDLADVLILAMPDIDKLVVDGRLKQLFIHPTPLYEFELYHFIHQKHQDRIKEFTQAFEQVVK